MMVFKQHPDETIPDRLSMSPSFVLAGVRRCTVVSRFCLSFVSQKYFRRTKGVWYVTMYSGALRADIPVNSKPGVSYYDKLAWPCIDLDSRISDQSTFHALWLRGKRVYVPIIVPLTLIYKDSMALSQTTIR